jgi:hypothetical protein
VESAASGDGISDLMLSRESGDRAFTLERLGIPGTYDVASGEICRLEVGVDWLIPGEICIVVKPGDICVCGACLETGEGIVCDWIAAFNFCSNIKSRLYDNWTQ